MATFIRYRFIVFAAGLMLLFMSAGTAFSAKLVVEPLPLDGVMREVVMSNPEILESINVYKGLLHELEGSKSGYKPVIGAEASVGQEYTNGVDTNDEAENLTASTAGIYLKQKLFDGFETKNLVGETRARLLAAAYETLEVANKVFINTAEAYLSVLRERELLALSEENVYIQTQILEQIKVKTESGFGRKSDLFNAESRLSLARSNVVSQQQKLKHALIKFHRQFGRFADPRQFEDPEMNDDMVNNVEDLIDIAFKTYPAIDVSKYNVIAKKYAMRKSEAKFYPTLRAEIRSDYSNNTGGDEGDTTSASAMVYFDYKFYDGGDRKAEKSKKYTDILKEHERSYVERRNLNESIRLAWNIRDAETRKHIFLKDYLDLSEKTLEAFKEEYQLGRRTLVELLDMENAHQEAAKAFVDSKYTSMTACFRLMNASGALLFRYNTGLFERVGLKDKIKDFNNLSGYMKQNPDRDADIAEDVKDQCDNSIYGVVTGQYGCDDFGNVKVGYDVPVAVEAYIKPKEEVLALEPEPVLEIDKTADIQTFNFDNILFDSNSSKLKKQSEPLLEEVANQLKTLKDYNLEIIGHTDATGSEAHNLKLSSARAKSVYNKLASFGVPAEVMAAQGKGESVPIASNATKEGRKKNRRIEFILKWLNQTE